MHKPPPLPIAFAALAIVIVHPLLPAIEGELFPVVSDATITHVEAQSNGTVLIHGEFEKFRNCAFLGLSWYLGTPQTGSIIPVEFSKAIDRDEGPALFGPWRLLMRQDQLGQSTAIVTHRCHPFWATETHFYPSVDAIEVTP